MDITLDQIIAEIHDEFPIKIPKMVISHIVRGALKVLYKNLNRSNMEFRFHKTDISRIYEITDGMDIIGAAMDLDETKIATEKPLVPVIKMNYYNILTHNTSTGAKKKKIIGFLGNRRR